MAGEIKIVDLPSDANVTGAEEFPVTDAGVTKKISTGALKDFALAKLAESGYVSDVTDVDIMVKTSNGLKRISWADFSSVLVQLSGEQTITGAKTFSGAVSVPTPTANGHAATKKYVDDGLALKVAAVSGKGLSTEDFTTPLKEKLEALPSSVTEPPVTSVNNKTGDVELTASDVGAAEQTPTFTKADSLSEPVGSGETSETLWGKVKKAIGDLISHLADTTIHITSAERTSWNGKQNALTFDDEPTSGSSNPVKSGGVKTALDGKIGTDAIKTSFANIPSDDAVPSEKLVKESLADKQDAALVTAWQVSPDNDHYPSEKLVKDSLEGTQTTANLRTSIRASATAEDTKYPSEKAVRTELDARQTTANLVTAFGSTPVNTKYPSEKLVKESLDAKGSMVTSFQATPDHTHYPSEKLVKDSLDAKQSTANLITAWQTVPDDTHYPSEKLVKETIASGGMTVDPTPTAGSTNPISSGGVYTALQSKQGTLTFDSSPISGSSNPVTSGGIKGALDEKGTKVTSWANTPSNTNYPSEKLVKDTIDSLGVGSEIRHDVSLAEGDTTKTFQVGSNSFIYYYVTDERTTSGTVQFKAAIDSGNKWKYQKILIYLANAKAGTINLSNVIANADLKYVRGDAVNNKQLTLTVGNGYLIQIEVFNKNSYQDTMVDVREYTK